MIAKDGQCVGSQRTCRNIKHARKPLTCDLVQVRDHKEQTLGCGVSRGQRACCQRTVNSAGGTRLGLHLRDLYGLAKDVLAAGCRPFIDMLGHDG